MNLKIGDIVRLEEKEYKYFSHVYNEGVLITDGTSTSPFDDSISISWAVVTICDNESVSLKHFWSFETLEKIDE